MIRFESDYTEGMHPLILQRLQETNRTQAPGYGEDPYCETARERIRKSCGNPALDIHFVTGGTQANLIVISSLLRPHQGVLSAQTGHIQTHECGAVEATGHRVIPLSSNDGKISAGQIRTYCEAFRLDPTHEHQVQPAMVYLSHPTENGTIYSCSELEDIRTVCRLFGLYLYLDGARLGYALYASRQNPGLPELSQLCDVFYIGGTKAGAMLGEAVVICNANLKKDFRSLVKLRGGLLAKGRLLGITFEVLFDGLPDCLYMKIAGHAVEQALLIQQAFAGIGCRFLYNSPTNQQFPILTRQQIEHLSKDYSFHIWQDFSKDLAAVRFCTSWATHPADVQRLIQDIKALPGFAPGY